MLIGLLSDTHLREEDLPEEIRRALRGVELILHAGDIYSLAVLDCLEALAPVRAARGYPDPTADDPRLALTQIVPAAPMKLGLVHDLNWPGPRLLDQQGQLLEPDEAALKAKFGIRPDIVIFGDTHQELVAERGGVLFINPGLAIPRPGSGRGTVARLEISARTARAEIVRL